MQYIRSQFRIGDISPAFESWLICENCKNLMGLCRCESVIIDGVRYRHYIKRDPSRHVNVPTLDYESDRLRFGMAHTLRDNLLGITAMEIAEHEQKIWDEVIQELKKRLMTYRGDDHYAYRAGYATALCAMSDWCQAKKQGAIDAATAGDQANGS